VNKHNTIQIKAALIVLLCIFNITLSAQQLKQTSIPYNKSGDTTVWYKWQMEKVKSLKIKHLAASTDSFKLRFWRDQILFELTTNDYVHFNGFAIVFTNRLPKKEKGKRKLVYRKYPLSDSLLTEVYKEYLKVKDIPSEEEIKGWSSGCDGETYSIETTNACCYSYKSYWSPYAVMDEVPEAALIETFADTVREILNLKDINKNFVGQLSAGKYNDGSMFTLHVPSKAQIKYRTKHWSDLVYLDKMRDSVNTYLSNRLTQIAHNKELKNWIFSYRVVFSKHNKVFEIKPIDKRKYITRFQDRQDYIRCKISLRKMLQETDLSFIKSRIAYSKRIMYIAKNISVY
jgi:hypothetical protein